MAVYWLNGKRVEESQATVPLKDHGLLYGDGVFEGLRFYDRRILLPLTHLRRLEDSARALRIQLPYSLDALHDAMLDMVEHSHTADGYIRLVVTRGVGPLGICPDTCERPTVFIIADALNMVSDTVRNQGLRVITAPGRRTPQDSLDSRIKSLNYLNAIFGRMAAREAGADEALMLNHQGYVTEGTVQNLFAVRDGVLLTPPASDGALAGITRALVLHLADTLGVPWREQRLTQYDLYTADECFLTGTGAELMPLRLIDGRPLPTVAGPLFQQLLAAFKAFARSGEEHEYQQWARLNLK